MATKEGGATPANNKIQQKVTPQSEIKSPKLKQMHKTNMNFKKHVSCENNVLAIFFLKKNCLYYYSGVKWKEIFYTQIM